MKFSTQHRAAGQPNIRPSQDWRTLLGVSIVAFIAITSAYLPHAYSETSTAQSSRNLAIGNTGEPETLDPHRYNLRLEETLLNDLFMGLTTFDAQGNIVPGAAESWHTSADGMTWTFKLRPDLMWSDGMPLTANDFVYSFRRLQNPETAASLAYFMHMLEHAEAINRGDLPVDQLGVVALDEHTLQLKLARPYPYLLERLLYPTAFPVPPHAIEKYGDAWIKSENWVSNGAYLLKEWLPQGHIALQANPKFVEPVAIQNITYYPVMSEQSAYNRYRSGELNVIATFPVGQLAKVKKRYPVELLISDLLSMFYLVINTSRPPFDDVRVRQALSLAVDQSILTNKIMRSGNAPALSFAPAFIQGYDPAELPHKELPLKQRQLQARKLLADAGFNTKHPLQITLKHITGLENKKLNLAISGMWKSIGVKAVLQQNEVRNHFADLRQADFDVAWAGWVGENNAEHYLTLLQSNIGSVNYGRFNNAQYDRLIEFAQQQADADVRNKALQAAELHVVDHYAVIPLYTNAVRRLVNKNLVGWHSNPRDIHQSRYLSWQD